jgi:hypothetical protein
MAGGPPPRQLCKIDLPTAYPCQAGFAMLVGQIATLPVGDHLGEAGRDLDQAAMWTKRRTDWRWLCCTRCGRGEGAACRSLISPAADRLPMASSTEGPCRPGARRVITACRGIGESGEPPCLDCLSRRTVRRTGIGRVYLRCGSCMNPAVLISIA